MKFSNVLVAATALGQCASASAVPNTENVALDSRSQEHGLFDRDLVERADAEDLWKRKGGGGGGSRGGGSTGGSSGSSGSRGGSGGSTGSSGSSRGGGSSGGTTGGTKGGTTGGTTGGTPGGSSGGSRGSSPGTGSTGGGGRAPAPSFTGPRPAFGGGRFYGGGATKPYRAGQSSPNGLGPVAAGAAGGLLLGSAIGFGAASWAHGAYRYPHSQEYTFHNATTNKQETKPVDCLCAKDMQCGCEDNTDKEYLDEIIGNGSYAALNKSLVDVGDYKGRSTIRINGTLPEGTTAENVDGDDTSDAQAILQAAGWWPVITTGLFMAFIV